MSTDAGGTTRRPFAVRLSIPYCLYVEDDAYEVAMESDRYTIHAEKLWRNADAARPEPEGAQVIVGPIGGDSVNVRQQPSGMELVDDPLGTHRYSRLIVTGQTSPGFEASAAEAFKIVLNIVNRFVDVYRYVSGRAYLPPVRSIDVDFYEVQWLDSREIEYMTTFGRGMTVAVRDESHDVHERLRAMLNTEQSVPIHAELLLAAQRMYLDGTTRGAVVEAVVALDAFVAMTLGSLVADNTMTQEEFDEMLRKSGQSLSDRMKRPMRIAIGRSPADDQDVWIPWIEANRRRRDVVHHSASASEAEAAEVIGTVQGVLRYLGDSGRHLGPDSNPDA